MSSKKARQPSLSSVTTQRMRATEGRARRAAESSKAIMCGNVRSGIFAVTFF